MEKIDIYASPMIAEMELAYEGMLCSSNEQTADFETWEERKLW